MQDRILLTAPCTINWQSLLCKVLVDYWMSDTDGEANPPSLATVQAALEDAKREVEPVLIEALKEACRRHGIEPRTSYDCPPIPVRNMDWSAYDDRTMDMDYSGPMGRGRTEIEALADLLEACE